MNLEIIDGQNSQLADFVKEISDNTFESEVLAVSMDTPVIVAFYSSFNSVCKSFIEMMEKYAKKTKGNFKLVKVNIDKCPIVTQALNVQTLPTVYIFAQGQAVDGFAGLLPESEIALFFEKISGGNQNNKKKGDLGLSEEEIAKIISSANDFFSSEEYDKAMEKYSILLGNDEENIEALAGMGWCLASSGDMESVKEILSNISDAQKNNDRIKGLEFISGIESNFKPDELLKNLNTKDFEQLYNLSKAYMVEGSFDDAIDCLVKIIAKDKKWQDGKAHKFLLDMFGALGNLHAAAKRGKRKLSAALFV